MGAHNLYLQEAVDLLQGIIKIPSISRDEGPVADYLARRLTDFGLTVERLGHSLVVSIQGQAPGRTLLLCSHIDTVPVAAGWTRDPFGGVIEGDQIFGLGANDAGASVVSMAAAARALGRSFAGKLLLAFVAEEEAGQQGFVAIEPQLPRYDAAIFGEPTTMAAAPMMRGAMQAILRSHGKACHASRPWQGKNACDAFAADLSILRAIDGRDDTPWQGTTIEPTIIQGGKSFNQIPALIETRLDIRTTPDHDNDWVEREFQKSGLDIEIVANKRRPRKKDENSHLTKALGRVQPPIPDYVFFGSCDMSFATAPSVVMGPGRSERSHAADEFIKIREIEEAILVYSAAMTSFFASE